MIKYFLLILFLDILYDYESKGNILDKTRNEHVGNQKPHTSEHDYPETIRIYEHGRRWI